MAAAPKQTDPQFKLRMPPQLRDEIEVAANANGRSMNAEIIERLLQSFSGGALDDGERRKLQRGIVVLLDNEARAKDQFKAALTALDRGDLEEAKRILTPLAWFERSDFRSGELDVRP